MRDSQAIRLKFKHGADIFVPPRMSDNTFSLQIKHLTHLQPANLRIPVKI